MSSWSYRLIPSAEKDFAKLDGSQKRLVLKALDKLTTNPLPRQEGGHGSPLGNKDGTALAGLLKLKLRGAGLRIVYDLKYQDETAYVIIIGLREDEQVYRDAAHRLEEYRQWLKSQTR